MVLKKGLRHLAGYIVGIGIFLVLIPYGIWQLASLDYPPFKIPILSLDSVRNAIAVLLFIIGMTFVVWSNIFLVFKGKGGPTNIGGVQVSPRTKALVVSGPYRHTRNPMVFGVFTVYAAMVVYLNSLACVVALVLFYLFIAKKFVAGEEKRLLNDFGDAYRDYMTKTPRVVPFARK